MLLMETEVRPPTQIGIPLIHCDVNAIKLQSKRYCEPKLYEVAEGGLIILMESLCPRCIPAYFLFQLFGVSLTLYFSIRFLIWNNSNALWKWIILSFHTFFFIVVTITLGLHASNDARTFLLADLLLNYKPGYCKSCETRSFEWSIR